MAFLKTFKAALILACLASIGTIIHAKNLIPEELKTSKNCKVILFKEAFKSSETKIEKLEWSGACKRGYVEGLGTLNIQWSNLFSEKISANYKEGKPDGLGTIEGEQVNGVKSLKKGTFFQGQIQGVGEISSVTENGEKLQFRGELLDGIPEGKGRIETKIYTYIGDFHDGNPDGVGRFEYESKSIYEGEVKKGKKNGKGKLTFENGVSVIGFFQDDQSPVVGRIEWPSGALYEGQIFKYKANGTGRMSYSDRTTFYGPFSDGVANGDGFVEYQGNTVKMNANKGKFTRIYSEQEVTEMEEKRNMVENQRRQMEDQRRQMEDQKEQLAERIKQCWWKMAAGPNTGGMSAITNAEKCKEDPYYDLRPRDNGYTCARNAVGSVTCSPN